MESTKKISVAIVEDNKVIKDNLCKYIDFTDDIMVAHHSGSVESFLHHLDKGHQDHFDILLLDIGLPGMTGLEGISNILERLPELDIIMLTTYEEEEKVLKALCSGAVAYISKKTRLAEITQGIRIVHLGGSYMSPSIARGVTAYLQRGKVEKAPSILSDRQGQILKELASGLTYDEIAQKFDVSTNTIRTHIKRLYKALNVKNKTDAITRYRNENLG